MIELVVVSRDRQCVFGVHVYAHVRLQERLCSLLTFIGVLMNLCLSADGDGSQDHLLPVCHDAGCKKSAIYLSKPGDHQVSRHDLTGECWLIRVKGHGGGQRSSGVMGVADIPECVNYPGPHQPTCRLFGHFEMLEEAPLPGAGRVRGRPGVGPCEWLAPASYASFLLQALCQSVWVSKSAIKSD